MALLFLFDKNEKLKAILGGDGEGTCPLLSAKPVEQLNKEYSFTFSVPGDHEDAQMIDEGDLVAFEDREGEYQLFEIADFEDIHTNIVIREFTCEHANLEMLDDYIDDVRPTNTTALNALTQALQDTRWQVGTVAELGLYSTNFYRENPIAAIVKIVNTWGGELRYRITVEDNTITGRYVDILARRGSDTGKRYEHGKDIADVKRTVSMTQVKTALRGFGKGEEVGDGFGRRIDFKDVVWTIANGDPADKPLDQGWIGDEDSRLIYGRPDTNETMRHRYGIFEDGEIEDPEILLLATYNHLQKIKTPLANYTMKVVDLSKLTGHEHEKTSLGDTVAIIDDELKLELKARVIEYAPDLLEEENDEVVLGAFLPLFTDSDPAIQRVIATVNDRSGSWDNPIVDDSNFPNDTPEIPTNFQAEGLFKVIMLKWDFISSSKIAAYEVYASQVQGFTTNPESLVWRGKSGGYVHEGEVNELWYFRLRAVNTHGTASDFTEEISAQTIRINAGTDIQEFTITNNLIAENAAIDFAKIAEVIITNAMIDSVSASKIITGLIDAHLITVTGDGQIKAVNSSDPTKYATFGNNGLYVAKGAISIERPDGYVTVNNGISSYDFSVVGGTPCYIENDGTVLLDNQYYSTNATSYKRFDYCKFKHTSLYVFLDFYGLVQNGLSRMSVIVEDELGKRLAFISTENGMDTNIPIQINLGVPTGQTRHLYLKYKTDDNAYKASLRLAARFLWG